VLPVGPISGTFPADPHWTHTLYLAVMSIVSHGAGAAVGAQAIGAGASILTGLRVALVLLVLAERPVETGTATAREGVDVVNASPVVQTGAGREEDNNVVTTDCNEMHNVQAPNG